MSFPCLTSLGIPLCLIHPYLWQPAPSSGPGLKSCQNSANVHWNTGTFQTGCSGGESPVSSEQREHNTYFTKASGHDLGLTVVIEGVG